MRIGVDARPLVSETPSGIGIYLIEILKNLNYNDEAQYVVYSNEPLRNPESNLNSLEQHIVGGKTGTIAVCFELGKQLKKDNIDVFLGTEHLLPLNCRTVKKVLTVYNLALMINPSWGSREDTIMQNVFCRLSCKCADKIIAVSETTRNDITNLLKINKERITVILNGGIY